MTLAQRTPLPGADPAVASAARARLDQLTKPPGSLGRLEDLAVRLCTIAGRPHLGSYQSRAIVVGAADHGVAAAGVSAYPREVTAQMVGGFLAGSAAVCALARAARANVVVVNFGVDAAFAAHPQLIDLPVARGTANLAEGPAMSVSQARAAVDAGISAFARIDAAQKLDLLALGEMGIGNTTSAAALVCKLTGAAPEDVAGLGTGVGEAGLRRKIAVIARALARGGGSDWQSAAAELGGFEIAGLAGIMLAAAARRVPIVLDGFIVGAAALLARSIDPAVVDYCIAAHRSAERGHRVALEALGLVPLLDFDLRLGEGSGAALAIPLVEAAARMYGEMLTFAEAGVATKGAGSAPAPA